MAANFSHNYCARHYRDLAIDQRHGLMPNARCYREQSHT